MHLVGIQPAIRVSLQCAQEVGTPSQNTVAHCAVEHFKHHHIRYHLHSQCLQVALHRIRRVHGPTAPVRWVGGQTRPPPALWLPHVGLWQHTQLGDDDWHQFRLATDHGQENGWQQVCRPDTRSASTPAGSDTGQTSPGRCTKVWRWEEEEIKQNLRGWR